MANEIEKKYRLTAEQRLEMLKALEEIGAVYEGEEFEENILFTGGDLVERNAVLRLRKIGDRTLVTFKQRQKSDFAVKHHTEYETEVSDFEEIANIFQSLGFRPALVYEKRRRTWKFRGVEIVIDILPFGDYMEIEGSVTGIAEAEMFLGAEELEVEHETYPRLTVHLGTRHGEVIEARFPRKILKGRKQIGYHRSSL